MHASSKMPPFICIISTEAPYRRPTSLARSSPKIGVELPSGVRTCEGRSVSEPPSARSGAKRSRSGSLLAVSHGNPLRSSIRRNASRLSPSRPCQPRLATSSRSPRIDFTGYRKIASTSPISIGKPKVGVMAMSEPTWTVAVGCRACLGVFISAPAKSTSTRIELNPREFVFNPYRGLRRKALGIVKRRYGHVNPFRIDLVLDQQRRATTRGDRA